MKKVNLIIFDLDGTLIDSKEAIIRSMNSTLNHFNLPQKSSDEIVSYVGRGIEELIKDAIGKNEHIHFNEIVKFFTFDFKQNENKYSCLFPNVIPLLEYFKQKQKIIVTNRKYEMALHALDYFQITHYFIDIIGGDDLSCMKPSGCPLERVTTKFHAQDENSIIIGDMAIDIESGKNAGILTCAFTGGIGKIEDIKKSDPDFIIHDLIQLKNIIT